MEKEFRDRNQYILNLAHKRDSLEEHQQEEGEDKENDRFLHRLTSAANFGAKPMPHGEEEEYDPEPPKNTVSHDEWVRRKEHEEKLKAKLI